MKIKAGVWYTVSMEMQFPKDYIVEDDMGLIELLGTEGVLLDCAHIIRVTYDQERCEVQDKSS